MGNDQNWFPKLKALRLQLAKESQGQDLVQVVGQLKQDLTALTAAILPMKEVVSQCALQLNSRENVNSAREKNRIVLIAMADSDGIIIRSLAGEEVASLKGMKLDDSADTAKAIRTAVDKQSGLRNFDLNILTGSQ